MYQTRPHSPQKRENYRNALGNERRRLSLTHVSGRRLLHVRTKKEATDFTGTFRFTRTRPPSMRQVPGHALGSECRRRLPLCLGRAQKSARESRQLTPDGLFAGRKKIHRRSQPLRGARKKRRALSRPRKPAFRGLRLTRLYLHQVGKKFSTSLFFFSFRNPM